MLVWCLAGCGFSTSAGRPSDGGPPDVPDAPPDAQNIDGAPGAARKRRITIPDDKVFANLADFPVWLVIDDPAGLGAKAAADASDIYFTRVDGMPLEYERIAWDKATGHLEAWVKITLTDGQANEFDLRFGDPGPWHAPNPLATWSNSFQAVWHMDGSLAASTQVADARGVVNGTAVGGPSSIAGKLGGGIDLDGDDDELTFTNPITGSTSHTISAWIAVGPPEEGFSSVLCIGNNATHQSRFLHTNYMGLANGFFGQDIQTNVNVQNNQFTLIHWVYDDIANTTAMYRDGMQVGTTANVTGTINTTGTAGHIGTAPMPWGPGGDTPNFVDGIVDEVRIASAPRSAGWVRTEYENQRAAKMFYTLGDDVPAQP